MESNIVTAKRLIDMKLNKIPTLVEGLLPSTGLVVLSGPSDSGKTTLVRQLSTDIVTQKEKFLEFDLNARHNRVIYVSTEDDQNAISFLLNKYNLTEEEKAKMENLTYIFNSDNLVGEIEKILTVSPVDLIVIDTFTDLYPGDLNMSNKVRGFLNQYRYLSLKYRCLVVFIHHPNKKADMETPNKSSLLGSQGIEAKARLVLDFRKEHANPEFRRLYITKGNYISDDRKNVGYRLKMKDDLTYEMLENQVSLSSSNPTMKQNLEDQNKKIKRVHELQKEGKSIRQIAEIMQGEGIQIKPTSVHKYQKMECSPVQTP